MRQRVIGHCGLATIALSSAAVALAAADRGSFLVPASKRGFPSWLAGPLSGSDLSLSYREIGWLLIVAFIGYLLVLAGASELKKREVFGWIGLIYLICFLAPPLFSADVFSYLGLARIDLLHGFDAYDTQAIVPYDEIQRFMDWKPRASVYGPLFTVFVYLAVPFGIAGGFWFLKAVTLVAGLGVVWLIWSTALVRGLEPQRATLLFAANPVVVLFAIGGVHNDVLIALVTVVGVSFYLKQRAGLAGAASAAVTAMKLSAVLPLPYMLIADRNKAKRFVVGVLLTTVVVALAALLIFGSDFPSFLTQLAGLQDRVAIASVPSQLGELFEVDLTSDLAQSVEKLIFAAVFVVTLFQTMRGRDWVSMVGWGYLALLLTSVWLLPWYLLWMLPFASLGRSKRLEFAAVGLTAYLLATRIPFLLG